MEQIPPPKEVKILETAEDIQERREQVILLLFVIYHYCLFLITKYSEYQRFD